MTSASGATPLVGRDTSLAVIATFLEEVATSGAHLVVSGDPGIGKTSLLQASRDRATTAGIRVFAADAAQFDTRSSFGALRELLEPLWGYVAHLDAVHGGTLETGLAGALGPPLRRGALGHAVLALLRQVAADGPVLLVLDDAQWVDPDTCDVVAFVARRLVGLRAGLLSATRFGSGSPLEDESLRHHRLAPLGEEESAILLDSAFPRLPAQVRERVLLEADGNPLALLELPHVLDTSSIGRSPAKEPSAPAVLRLFGPRIRALPDRTREFLLLHALEGSGDLGLLAKGAEEPLGLSAPAENAGLVLVDEAAGRLRFRHPLVTTTVVELATEEERLRAHARIAQALQRSPERRAWHLAAATSEPDETVATELELQFRDSSARGDVAGGLRLLQRAAELSPEPSERARRQVMGAFIEADVTGDLRSAARTLLDADDVASTGTQSLPATLAATYVLLNSECEVDTAHRLLREAINRHPGRDDPTDGVLEHALHSLLMMSWFGGRPAQWSPFLEAVERLGPGCPPLVDLVHRAFGDASHQGASALPLLTEVLRHVDAERDPLRITRIALACVYTDRMGECRQALRRVVDSGYDGGAVALSINALVSSCVDDWLTGQWDEALELVAEGVRLCEQHGYRRYSVILAGYIDQLVRVARGDQEGGLRAAEEMAEWAEERGAGLTRSFAEHLFTLRSISLGDYETAYGHVTRIAPAGELAAYNPHALWVLFDLVESAMATGRAGAARQHVAAMREHRIDRISPRLRMVADGCAALASTGEEASNLFERALATPDGRRWPFDRARIQLAYGEHLHRCNDPAARAWLTEATTTFGRLGARPWEARAAKVLRASGTSVSPRVVTSQSGADVLSPREREIADLAAQGLSNREIGERLYLSHRSVGAALYRMFPKLGITTRAALAAALERLDQPDADG
ncbi:ATP-binding protein [Nocardioides astragali]|uniref:ATP-binding protein n=1 Tax=Nocardioides astragali TaxID=1776736 RepID=A0ABW2N2L1_9ACTN|nr:LuxR family transcriptional regulator [Nocardioides astragali]